MSRTELQTSKIDSPSDAVELETMSGHNGPSHANTGAGSSEGRMNERPQYYVPYCKGLPFESLNGEYWRSSPVAEISHFHHRSSDFRPKTQVRMAHSGDALHVLFTVDDRYVLSRQTRLHSSVCTDSCVELFIRPKPGRGYFNIEINAGGTLLMYFVEDPTRTPTGLRKFSVVPQPLCERIEIHSSLPKVIDPEITTPVKWMLRYSVPVSVFEHFLGNLGSLNKQQWTGNLYKCADHSSHPHWASWSPIGEELNFHRPDFFAPIVFQ